MEVRTAQEQDLKYVFKLNEIAMEKLKDHFPLDYDVEFANGCIVKSWEEAPCFLLCDGDKIVGFYGMMFTTNYYSPERVLADYMIFVLPKYAKLDNIKLLLQAGKGFADSLGLPVFLNYQTFKDVATHKRMFEIMGFEVSGLNGIYYGGK